MTTASTTQATAHASTTRQPSKVFTSGKRPRTRRSFLVLRIGDGTPSGSGTASGSAAREDARVQPRDTQVETALECLECGDVTVEGRGWKAYVDEEDELLVYCACCAEREFGE